MANPGPGDWHVCLSALVPECCLVFSSAHCSQNTLLDLSTENTFYNVGGLRGGANSWSHICVSAGIKKYVVGLIIKTSSDASNVEVSKLSV